MNVFKATNELKTIENEVSRREAPRKNLKTIENEVLKIIIYYNIIILHYNIL